MRTAKILAIAFSQAIACLLVFPAFTAAAQQSDTGSVPGTMSSDSAPQAQAKSQGPVRIAGGVTAGQLLTHQNPVYPPEAKAKGISGTVVLHAIIGNDGTIKKLVAISGPELLAQASIDAVQHWTYRPYMLNGEPTEVDTTITVNFNLNNSPPNHPLLISNGVMAGMLISRKDPELPAVARAAHVSGSVVLRATIGKDGSVKQLEAMSGPDMLKQSAIDAASQWKYRPYIFQGQPAEVSTTITVNFPQR